MADKKIKNTGDKKEPPEQNGDESRLRDDGRRRSEGRRRLPLAALAVLLALVGIGIYVAWPNIQESLRGAPAPAQEVAQAEADNAGAEPVRTVEPVSEPEPEPAPAPAPPEPSPALTALAAQVAALERELAERDAVPEAPPPDLTPIHDALARLEELEKRLDERPPAIVVENLPPPPPEAAPDDVVETASDSTGAVLDFQTLERLDSLERALDGLEARDGGSAEIEALRAGQAALRDQVAALGELLETAGGREAESGRMMVLVLSLSKLSRAAATAAPFARQVEAFGAALRADGAPGLAVENALRDLAAPALTGAPTAAGLAAAFDDVALAVIHADGDAEDQGWVDATIGRLRRVVTVRRVGGDIEADSLEGRLSALHQALAGGDLAGAVALGEALPAKARAGAEDWLRGARARLAIEGALAALDGEISDRVAARWATRRAAAEDAGK